MWNLVASENVTESISKIKLRGDNPDSFLTGEFARRIAAKIELDAELGNGEISKADYNVELPKSGGIDPLSVSSIADRYCPTRIDLYLTKGLCRPKVKDIRTWGRIAGPLVEKHLFSTIADETELDRFGSLISRSKQITNDFAVEQKNGITNLSGAEGKQGEAKIGDTDWFLKLLDYNGRAELAMKILNSQLKEAGSIDITKVIRAEINPIPAQIGISNPASPDFMIPDAQIVGDIKTGTTFAPSYQLTCAGYALALENQTKGLKINWGIIYFFPTRNPSAYVKPITFAQVYIFPIDDVLRRWFLSTRNEAYKIISSSSAPKFPDKLYREHCPSCKYYNYCQENGLEKE